MIYGKKGLEIKPFVSDDFARLIKNGFVRHHADQVEHVLGLGERLRLLSLDMSAIVFRASIGLVI